MTTLKTLILGGLATAAIGQAHARDAVMAWQEPQPIMDEIIVTMYEVVVTAQAPSSSSPGQEALAEVAALLESHIREIVAAAQHSGFVTKISSNGRIYFAPWRI
jgi:hypothetical protein